MKLADARVPRSLTLLAPPLLGAALVVVGIVGMTAATRVTVRVTVTPRTADTAIPLRVADPATASVDDLPGIIRETTVEVSTSAPASGTTTVEGASHGSVRIENHWNQVQPLAATTRLTTSTGILFRTTERVDVPAGGSVTVDVVADQKGEAGNVGPEHFTIVALWPGLQEKIFGTSSTAMTGGGSSATAVTEADLIKAQAAAEAQAAKDAVADLAKDLPAGLALLEESIAPVTTKTLNRSSVGTVATEASIRLRVSVRGLVANAGRLRAAVATAVQQEFPGESPTGFTLIPKLDGAELPGGPFTVLVNATLAPTQNALQPALVAGKTRAAAVDVLKRAPGVSSVRITGLPFWARTLPPASRIRIVVAINE
jgi:hypothetical protein